MGKGGRAFTYAGEEEEEGRDGMGWDGMRWNRMGMGAAIRSCSTWCTDLHSTDPRVSKIH